MLSAYRCPLYPRRYLLSQNPEAEAHIVAELRELGLLATPEQPHPRALEYTDLAKLTYLNDALKVLSTTTHCPYPSIPQVLSQECIGIVGRFPWVTGACSSSAIPTVVHAYRETAF